MTATRVPGCPGLLSSWWDKITWQHTTRGRKVYLRSESPGTSHSWEAKVTGPKICNWCLPGSLPVFTHAVPVITFISIPLRLSPSGPAHTRFPLLGFRFTPRTNCMDETFPAEHLPGSLQTVCVHPPDNSDRHWRNDRRKLPGRERRLTNYNNPLAHRSENQSRKSPSYILCRL